jgi:hypothetical protein
MRSCSRGQQKPARWVTSSGLLLGLDAALGGDTAPGYQHRIWSKMGNWRWQKKTRPGRKRDLRDGRKVMRLEYSSARESAAPGCYHRDRRLQYGPSDRPGTIAAFAIWSIVSVPIFRHGSPN